MCNGLTDGRIDKDWVNRWMVSMGHGQEDGQDGGKEGRKEDGKKKMDRLVGVLKD